MYLYSAAPDAQPTNLVSVNVRAFSVDLQWDGISFLNENGPNVFYNVLYGVQEDLERFPLTTTATSATINGLRGFTTYEITVAGQNEVGPGPASSTLVITTLVACEYLTTVCTYVCTA